MGRGLRVRLTVGAVVGACVGASIVHPPRADASVHQSVTVVRWGGVDCMWMRSPTYGNYWDTTTDHVCSQYHEITVHTPVVSGQYVGVDPYITAGITWAGCVVIMDGQVEFADYSEAGDGSDVNCLRVVN